MANEEKNYFKRPNIKQIKKDKKPIVVNSMQECIEKVIELAPKKYDLKNEFLHIKFNPIPEKFMSFGNPSKAFVMKGRYVDTLVTKNQRISNTLYERLFNTLKKISNKELEKRVAFAISYLPDNTNDYKKSNYLVLRPNDWIRAAKLRSLEKYTPSALDVKTYFHKKEDYAHSIVKISGLGKISPIHNFSIIKIPRRKIKSYLDYVLMSFSSVTGKERISEGDDYVNRRQLFEIETKRKNKKRILNPEQILALKVTEEILKKKGHNYLSKISMIAPLSQIAADIHDILTNHTIINRNPRFDRVNNIPTLADIDVIMLNIMGQFAKTNNYSIIRPMDYKGNIIKPEDIDFQLFDTGLNKYYHCGLYAEPNKKNLILNL
jgi:hypothetical protein